MAPIERTRKLWDLQNRHEGDRLRLFTAVRQAVDATTVLYPGSFVDVAASFVFPSVTYVDLDRRADQFFADQDGVDEIVSRNQIDDRARTTSFVHGDYREDLGLEDQSFDLLVSLYAGFISESCTRYLRVGGALLVNPSHGDAAMASLDARYQLVAVVMSANGDYRIVNTDLDQYLVPKKPKPVTVESVRAAGRGVAYTKPAFAYIFERQSSS